MSRIIGVTDLQRKFRLVFDEVARGGQSVILTRGSRPEAALIPYQQYERLQKLQKDQVLDRFDLLRSRLSRQNASYTDSEIEADLREADQELGGVS